MKYFLYYHFKIRDRISKLQLAYNYIKCLENITKKITRNKCERTGASSLECQHLLFCYLLIFNKRCLEQKNIPVLTRPDQPVADFDNLFLIAKNMQQLKIVLRYRYTILNCRIKL